MKFLRKRTQLKAPTKPNANMALAGFDCKLRRFLALGSLCAATASLAGVKHEKLEWLQKNLNDFERLEHYQFHLAEAMINLLPFVQQQLSVKVSPRLLQLIEQADVSEHERAVLYHEIGSFFLKANDQKHAGQYFLKAQKKMAASKKASEQVAKLSHAEGQPSWPVSEQEPLIERLGHAKECGLAARYYLDTASRLGDRQQRKAGAMLHRLCHKLEHRISHFH